MKEFIRKPTQQQSYFHEEMEFHQNNSRKKLNEAMALMYFWVIRKLKRSYENMSGLQDIIEIDNTITSNVRGNYCFISEHVFLYLETDIEGTARIEYFLHKCPPEIEIIVMNRMIVMQQHGGLVIEVKHANYPEFFKRMLKEQPAKFITRV